MSINPIDLIIPEVVKFLQDKNFGGKERPWKIHKQNNILLSESYQRIGEDKWLRVYKCGSYLLFEGCPNGHMKKLKSARFCKDRLCSMCSWRKSLVMFKQLSNVLHIAQNENKLRFMFLTLTAKNVTSFNLNSELDKYFSAWNNFSRLKSFKNNVVGWFRTLEITHNLLKDSYHPHFHVLFAVKPNYFSHGYIKHEEWCGMWQKSMKLDYKPIVDIRMIKPRENNQSLDGAILESVKYSVKSSDYINKNDIGLTDHIVKILSESLYKRRLISYGGIFKDVRKKLNQKDVENADLIHIDENNLKICKCKICQSDFVDYLYKWHVGYKNYISNSIL